MKLPHIALLLFLTAPLALAADEPTNLLKNGDFADLKDETTPDVWAVEKIQKVSIDKVDVPDGLGQALKVEITTEKEKSQGSISQTVKVDPNKAYKIVGLVKASAPRLGFIQVKRRVGKKEDPVRVYTAFGDSDWKEVSKVFTSGDSDNVLIICRFNQKPEQLGQSVSFAGIKLVEATPEEAANIPAPEIEQQ
jgi:hypothetical protein